MPHTVVVKAGAGRLELRMSLSSSSSAPVPFILTPLLGAMSIALLASVFGVHDLLTWVLETFPVMVAIPLLWLTRRRFPLTTLLYVLIALHCLVLIVGGHYTYARVPLGFWMQDWFDFGRNHYDRIGHFMQGFVPAMIAREILRRRTPPLPPDSMLALLCVSVALAVSAVYEIVEMIAGRVSAEAAAAFLGTQGDSWDTQMDMSFAGIGATCAVLFLTRWHERALASIKSPSGRIECGEAHGR